MCAAHGKPKPSIRWLKGDKDVSSQLFDIVTDENESKYCTLQNFCYDPNLNLLLIYKKFFGSSQNSYIYFHLQPLMEFTQFRARYDFLVGTVEMAIS